MKTPILETSRLWLKPLKEEDAPGAFLWTGDPKVSWYMRYETHESLEDTKQWLREEEKQLEYDLLYDFGFHKKDNDELIGSGGLPPQSHSSGSSNPGAGCSQAPRCPAAD